MARRELSRVRGFVHDIERVTALSTDPTNIRLLSDRSLYVLQNLSGEDVTFLGRYGEILSGGFYLPVQSGTSEAETVTETIDIIRRDLNDMSVEDTLVCICGQLQTIAAGITSLGNASQSCDIGSGVDSSDGEEGGALPDPVSGIEYEEPSAIEDRKCLAANYIHQQVLAVVTELDDKKVDTYGFAGLSFVVGLITTIVGGAVLGPFGFLVGAVAGGVIDLAILVISGDVSLTNLKDALEADEDAAICALFEATTAESARSSYVANAVSNGATSEEASVLSGLIPNNALNLLFFAWGDSEDTIAAVTPTSDCSTCVTAGCPWLFTQVMGGDAGSGDLTKDGSSRVITAVDNGDGYYRIYMELDTASGNPGADCDGEITINAQVEFVSIDPGGTEAVMGERQEYWWAGGTFTDDNFPYPISTDPIQELAKMEWSYTSPFTITMKLNPGNYDS